MPARKIANLLIFSSLLTLSIFGFLQWVDFRPADHRTEKAQPVLLTTPTPLPELVPEKIIIPKLSLDLEIKSATVSGNYWPLNDHAASWLKTSAHLNQNSNTVIYAHNTWRLFGRLGELELGDRVLIEAEGQSLVYSVRQKMTVKPDYLEIVAPTPQKRLTLFTCTNFLDADRLVVIAEPVRSLGDILEESNN